MIVGLAIAAPATASTPAAWRAEADAARAACVATSGLVRPMVRGPVAFDDSRPIDVLLLTGGIAARRGASVRVAMVCLYDRATRRARAVEAEGWPAAR